ncbi:unnamed protein product [Phaedon cochleariae]|uniref:Uncharacterized protein n=1 Tax=Phaedon cochleariae TaxID=80249 RepID=A0A9P0GPU0_PHACE|nr:unnamed protein product [Phaedon cochleariae]
MCRLFVIFVVVSVIGLTAAQINFTPNWGKRSLPNEVKTEEASSRGNYCHDVDDNAIKLVYEILKSEAKKLVECERLYRSDIH